MDAVTRDLAIHIARQLAVTDRSADRYPSLAEYHRGEVAAYRDTLSWLAGYAGLGSIDRLLSELDELAAAAQRQVDSGVYAPSRGSRTAIPPGGQP